MKRKLSYGIMLGLVLLMLLLNVIARLFHPAADWYIANVFPSISGFWCKVSGLFPFSVGEWMIVLGIVLILAGIMSIPIILIFGKDRRKQLAHVFLQCYGWILTWLFCIMTTRFFILYQGTQLSKTLPDTDFTNEEVLQVCRRLVEEANQEGALVARDEEGYFKLTDALMPEAKACMGKLSESYPQFCGSYPDAKPIYHAYFFSQQNLLGIYYPHSMEANYNPVVYEVNLPVTICHEYTHLKGNIFEDEAGYYAFLACMMSDSHDFRYSGYISALEWLQPDFGEDDDAWIAYEEIMAEMTPQVSQDMYTFVPESYWVEHRESDEVIPTAIVADTADMVMDASLKVNGIVEGVHSYHGMTALLLHHYLNETNAALS